jgi:hypothetical protein
MITRIWHGATHAAKSDGVPKLDANCRHPRLPLDPLQQGAYALRGMEGDTAHFLMVTSWESEEAIRAFAKDDISVAKYYDFDKDFLIELEPCSTHYDVAPVLVGCGRSMWDRRSLRTHLLSRNANLWKAGEVLPDLFRPVRCPVMKRERWYCSFACSALASFRMGCHGCDGKLAAGECGEPSRPTRPKRCLCREP